MAVDGTIMSAGLSDLPGTRARWSLKPGGGFPGPAGCRRRSRVRRRSAYTVMGTSVPARAMTLEGTTRNSKSGRGGRMCRR